MGNTEQNGAGFLELFSMLTEHASDWLAVISSSGIVRASGGQLPEQVLGFSEKDLYEHGFLHGVEPEWRGALISALTDLQRGEAQVEVEHRRRTEDGSSVFLRSVFVNRLADPAVKGIVVTTRLVGDGHGIRDRAAFLDHLQRVLENESPFAVTVIELRNHRSVSAAVGHGPARRLLGSMARRIQAAVHPNDMVAQVGDSHFAVLLRNEGDDERAHAAAERIGGRLRAPFRIGGREVVVSAALGFVTSSRFYNNAESALADAEAAAHRAQRFPQRFQTSMRVADRREVALAAALPRAIERNELQARYQPIIDLKTGEVVSVEALVRWMHPELGLVSPVEFVPLAETSDAILALDRWMLVESTRQLAAWGSRADLRLSVNISARHLEHPRLPEAVAAALSASGLAPSRLRIEVTETAFAGDVQGSIDALHRLRQIGVSLALDDFGTGYSSFAQLADLPFDVLKIDRSMIGRLDGIKGRNVVPGIVSMAHQLGLEVVAEGIETASQVEALRALGSDFGQGFLFSKPLPGNQLLDLLTNRPIW